MSERTKAAHERIADTMTLDDYQHETMQTAIYPGVGSRTTQSINYCLVGLCGEVGELANKWKKVLRGDQKIDPLDLAGELGDCLWYLARLADELEIGMNGLARLNLTKLHERKARDAVRGSGDDR